MRIYDLHGNEQDEQWLRSNYGDVEIQECIGSAYTVSELREVEGPMAIDVRVRSDVGAPVGGVVAVFWYSTAQELPNDSGWFMRGATAVTNIDGKTDFIMSGDSAYFLPSAGPHNIWLYGDCFSVMISGLGWLGGTNHRHLNITFAIKEQAPPVGECDCEFVMHKLLGIQELVQGLMNSLVESCE